ncbi:hypothetical protein ACFWTE_16260 [Nocardiopsis sp. NPDC058631]|uniref:hypothetical protein n=1 Tax=Nocardiopsis sp. NPDC058631 TaxID=3346566 RepID=UPI0036650177
MARVVRGSSRIAASGWGGALAAGLVAVGLAAVPASAEENPRGLPGAAPAEGDAPLVGLSVTVGDEPPNPGREITLRTTVANSDSDQVRDALLAQHFPEALEVLEVDHGGAADQGIVNWRVDVPPGEEVVYTVRARVVEGAGPQERVMSTACLLLDRDADPAACASNTVVVTEATMMSRVSEFVDPNWAVRSAGAVLAVGLAWMLWRQRGILRRR